MEVLLKFFERNASLLKSEKLAYNQEEFQSYIVEKTKKFVETLGSSLYKNVTISKIAGLSFVCLPSREATKIIDLGGGAGLDFFIARELFGINFNWEVVETEVMCNIVAQEILDNRLRFNTLGAFLQGETNKSNFALYANSSLQYLPDQIKVLNLLLLKKPSKVAILRTPFVVEGEEVTEFQDSALFKNGPQIDETISINTKIRNEVTIIKIKEVKNVFKENGYEIICENSQEGSFTKKEMVFKFRQSKVRTFDLLFRQID
jgi:putative methyltransferase (TIGR04325 family)